MPDWKKLVEDHHQWAHAKDDYELVMLPPASAAELQALEATLGFAAPRELRSFYEQVGGCGVKAPDSETYWLVVPVTEVAANIASARDWFDETHPRLAKRFFPFISWASGDYTGYLKSPLFGLKRGLYTFEHEGYEFEAGQLPWFFMKKDYKSLEDIFTMR